MNSLLKPPIPNAIKFLLFLPIYLEILKTHTHAYTPKWEGTGRKSNKIPFLENVPLQNFGLDNALPPSPPLTGIAGNRYSCSTDPTK